MRLIVADSLTKSVFPRRSLFALATLGLTARAFAEPNPQNKPEPGPGEILLEGKITGGSRKERKMTLLVDKIVSASGTQTALDPPRSRDVQLSDKTGLVNLVNPDQTLVAEGLSLDLRVSVIGKDLGTGQIVPARLILVDAATLEQRTLLERGQLAVATQTFTPLGKSAWWNFRCSDAAKATLTAYRGGLKMTVEKAAQQQDVQLQQGDMDLAEGDTVTVAFRAKADRNRALHVEAQVIGGSYADIGLVRDIRLSTEWQACSLTFAARTIGKRNQVIFGVGQEQGTVWLESVRLTVAPGGRPKPAKPVAVAKSGTRPFTGALVSQADLLTLIGKRYNWARGGEQPFTLLLSSEDDPVQLVPIILTAQPGTSKLETEDGVVGVRILDWKRAGATRSLGYLMIGPDGEMIKSENGASFFAEPLYRMRGPATKTPTGWDMQMQEPYRDRWRIEKTGAGWKVSILYSNGKILGFVETDANYQPTRIQWPLSGNATARVFPLRLQAERLSGICRSFRPREGGLNA